MLPIDDVTSLKPTFPEETRLEIFGDRETPLQFSLTMHASMSARAHIVRYEVDQERVDLIWK